MPDRNQGTEDDKPAGSSAGSRRSTAQGPWWLEGSAPRRLRREPFFELPPALVAAGALWSIVLGWALAIITVGGYACEPPPPSATLLELFGAHITGIAAVAAVRTRASRRFRAALCVPPAVLFAATVVAWVEPRALDMRDHPLFCLIFRIAGGVIMSLGVYAFTHLRDASRALGRALAFVTFAPFAIGLAATLLQRVLPFSVPNAGLLGFGVAMGIGTAIAWWLAVRSVPRLDNPLIEG